MEHSDLTRLTAMYYDKLKSMTGAAVRGEQELDPVSAYVNLVKLGELIEEWKKLTPITKNDKNF